ncbi:hypothetical protein F5Y11DRAFT_136964 [Daldinia sp. FL1419]|nr:hypothetical protein F5Y11DRAFT_136964 [Daldinia sp. FL1419]
MAPQKPRCTFKECRSAAQRIVGDCGFCDGHFCAKHRLLEDHKCSGLEDVSMNPTPTPTPSPSDSGEESADDWAQEWWLVGLAEYFGDSGFLEEECGGGGGVSSSCSRLSSGVLTRDPKYSARKNPTSETRPNSRPRGRKSSGAYKIHPSVPPSSRVTARRRRRSPPGVRPQAPGPVFASTATTTNPPVPHLPISRTR